jgi:hypothetical protein
MLGKKIIIPFPENNFIFQLRESSNMKLSSGNGINYHRAHRHLCAVCGLCGSFFHGLS